MQGGGKKYNIWIAYADLFTNLSAFLFISAIGVFAAIGSGKLAVGGIGTSAQCNVPEAAEKDLIETPKGFQRSRTLISHLRDRAQPPPDCARYYGVGGGYRFRSIGSNRRDFINFYDRDLGEPEVRSRICRSVWLVIARQDFLARGGRVVFRGIANPQANEWDQQPPCEERMRGGPRLIHGFNRSRRSGIALVEDCRTPPEPGEPEYPFCADVRDCLDRPSDNRNDLCRNVNDILAWNARAILGCHAKVARQQAYTLYEICERAPTYDDFQNQLYDDRLTYVDAARRPDSRGDLWERVDYAAHLRRERRQTEPIHPLDALPGGTVAIEVQYSR